MYTVLTTTVFVAFHVLAFQFASFQSEKFDQVQERIKVHFADTKPAEIEFESFSERLR